MALGANHASVSIAVSTIAEKSYKAYIFNEAVTYECPSGAQYY